MAHKGKKDKKARLKRDATETLLGVVPFSKLGRAIKARKLKKNNPEEKQKRILRILKRIQMAFTNGNIGEIGKRYCKGCRQDNKGCS